MTNDNSISSGLWAMDRGEPVRGRAVDATLVGGLEGNGRIEALPPVRDAHGDAFSTGHGCRTSSTAAVR